MTVADAKEWCQSNIAGAENTLCQSLFVANQEQPLSNGALLASAVSDRTLFLVIRPPPSLLLASGASFSHDPGAGDASTIVPPASGWMCSPGGSYDTTSGAVLNVDMCEDTPTRRVPTVTVTFARPVDVGSVIILAENNNCPREYRIQTAAGRPHCVIYSNPRTPAARWDAAEGIPLPGVLENVTELSIAVTRNHGDHYFGINVIRLWGWLREGGQE
jgi:hypothetical protein